MKINNNDKYINYTYSSFLYDWQNYYKNNFLTFFEEIDKLKSNLDNESKNNIDQFIDKIIFKLKLPTNNYLIKKDYLYNNLEQKIIKQEKLTQLEIDNYKKKYKINNNYLLQISVFRYHNGLKLLPKNTQNSIKNKTIIDGGAYYGDSSLIFTKYQPKIIYSFEPCSVNYNFLNQTIINNNLQKFIIPINKGIYENNITSKIYYNSSKLPNLGAKISHHNISIKKQELVSLITIDNFVQNNNLHDISVIKLDIEGMEFEAILGAKKTIKKYKPILLIAIYHNAEEFLNIKKFIENLNCGYKFLIRSLDKADILQELYLIAYIP